ncbi:MAG: hypothetical protein NZ772_10140 [Cyanobacteria bacterium]|nr:hypothetical protein [Cyanobacteriota bacterium]MDW8201360.1 hypothetical protein [Cyanobacteriota bacterium SKYGB_h_bin112]
MMGGNRGGQIGGTVLAEQVAVFAEQQQHGDKGQDSWGLLSFTEAVGDVAQQGGFAIAP